MHGRGGGAPKAAVATRARAAHALFMRRAQYGPARSHLILIHFVRSCFVPFFRRGEVLARLDSVRICPFPLESRKTKQIAVIESQIT